MANLFKKEKFLPRALRGILLDISGIINYLYGDLRKTLEKKVRSVSDYDSWVSMRPEVRFDIASANVKARDRIAFAVKDANDLGVSNNTKLFSSLGIDGKAPEAWAFYLLTAQNIIGRDVSYYLNRTYPFGGSLAGRFTTIISGSEKVVDSIIRRGIAEGWSAWDIAKKVGQYISPDRRGKLVAPWTIIRRERGLPISYVPEGVPAGAVDYNALRIARTEIINSYRRATIESSRDNPFVVGWRWVLSPAHPKCDICDEWAAHDEGLGEGVYSDPVEVSSLGHPNCLCHIDTVTIFHNEMRPYFDEMYKELRDTPEEMWAAAGFEL